MYPMIPCKDGAIRLVLLAPRQWKAMWEWMGSPEEFAERITPIVGAGAAVNIRAVYEKLAHAPEYSLPFADSAQQRLGLTPRGPKAWLDSIQF